MGLKATLSTLVPRCCLVPQKRKRIVIDGYDVDMSYITDRILAMSFPGELMISMYKKPMMQIKGVVEKKHAGHYKVYNLCTEDYDPADFNYTHVERFPFDDNHAPSLQMVKEFCESVHAWLSSDPENIIFIHCMGSKGRIGLMVSSYLVYIGKSPEESLQSYVDKGTKKNLGVMLPSQRRYVNYWHKSLTFPEGFPPKVNLPTPPSREFRRIRLFDTKNFDHVFFVVSEMQEVPGERYMCKKIKNGGFGNSCSEIEEEEEGKTSLDYYFDKSVQVIGDMCVIFYEKFIGGRLFYACFNTAFIENNSMQFTISELDKVGNKGKSIAGPEFHVEFLFSPANPNPDDSQTVEMAGR